MLEQGYTPEDMVNRSVEEITSWQLTLSTLIAITEPVNAQEDECPPLENE